MPRGKGKSTIQLIEACHEILSVEHPTTVRGVAYRLFTRGLIPDMSKSSTNKVSRNLTAAREEHDIPWNWIVDETREAEQVQTWSEPEEIIRGAVNGYRRDSWQDQGVRVEVWSEKGTVRGILGPVLDEFGVTFRVMHGFASATVVNTVAEESNASDKPLIALYVGDHDPSGRFMSDQDLPTRLHRYGGSVDLRRIALIQSDLPELPSFDAATKRGDRRYEWFTKQFGFRCWELDAMPSNVLRERVRAAITDLIDDDAWEHALDIERAQVASMHEFHDAWRKHIEAGA